MGKPSLLFVCILLLLAHSSQAQFGLRFDNIGMEDGLAHYQVRSIVKDYQGFIWIATANGLQRYDGHSLKTYRNEIGKPKILGSNVVRALLFDSQGYLWIGTRGGGITRMKDGRFETWQHQPENPFAIPSNNVEDFAEDRWGNIWIGTRNDGLWRFGNGKLKHFLHDPKDSSSLSSNSVYKVLVDSQDRVWAATFGGGLNLLNKDGSFTRFQHDPKDPNSLSGNSVISLYEAQNGDLWVGTWQTGLNRIKDGQITRFFSQHPKFHNSSILDIAEDYKGNLWIGTWGNGLLRLNTEGRVSSFTSSPFNDKSLCNDYIECVFADRTGVIWVGSYAGGISKLVQGDFKTYQATFGTQGLQSNFISDVYEDSLTKALWISTYGEGLYCYQDGEFQNFRSKLPNGNNIWSTQKDVSGTIWLGAEAGLFRLQGQQLQEVPLPDPISGDKAVYELGTDQKGRVLCGSRRGEVFRIENGRPQKMDLPEYHATLKNHDSPDSSVFFLMEDRKKRIWIGGGQGLKMVDENGVHYIKLDRYLDESLLGMAFKAIIEDSQGTIWVGTGYGLAKYSEREQSLILVNSQAGMPETSVLSIQEAPKGELWLGTINGLYHYSINAAKATRYTVTDGLPSNVFTIGSSAVGTNGRIYMGSQKGLVSFHPDSLSKNRQFPIKLTEFSILNQPVNSLERFDKPLEVVERIELSYEENSFTFEVSTLDYIRSEQQYVYRLEGLKQEKPAVTKRRHSSYTNLDPGKYTFYAYNADYPNNPVSIDIIIKPPFWQTLWFRALSIVSVALLLLGIYLYRVNRLKYQKAILEATVAERTDYIRQQKKELQQQTKKLSRANQSLHEKTEALQSNSERLRSTNHKLKQTKKELQQLLLKEQAQLERLRQAHEELKSTQIQLVQSEKMASLGVLTAGIAHEINNPINFVLGGSHVLAERIDEITRALRHYQSLEQASPQELLKVQKELEHWKKKADFDREVAEDALNLTRDIQEGARRIAEIVKGLHTFSRGGQEQAEFTDLHQSIDSTLVVLHSKYKDRVEIRKSYEESLPKVLCHSGKISQVFMNLLANAMQAIDGEGAISIKTQQIDNDRVKVSICDTGSGMPEDVRKKIFDPFFTTKDVGKGTGLGLYITRTIIEQHYGRIEVESQEGQGTEFIITLPINQKPADHVQIKMSSSGSGMP